MRGPLSKRREMALEAIGGAYIDGYTDGLRAGRLRFESLAAYVPGSITKAKIFELIRNEAELMCRKETECATQDE